MRRWLRDHGLLLVNLGLFAVFLVAMTVVGVQVYNSNQLEDGESTVSWLGYLGTGDFVEATFENWESEFLQMGAYVVLTVVSVPEGLVGVRSRWEERDAAGRGPARGRSSPGAVAGPPRRLGAASSTRTRWRSSSSSSSSPRSPCTPPAAPRPTARSSWPTAAHRSACWQYLATSQFWFESFQNWQSEFLAVAAHRRGSRSILRATGLARVEARGRAAHQDRCLSHRCDQPDLISRSVRKTWSGGLPVSVNQRRTDGNNPVYSVNLGP